MNEAREERDQHRLTSIPQPVGQGQCPPGTWKAKPVSEISTRSTLLEEDKPFKTRVETIYHILRGCAQKQ